MDEYLEFGLHAALDAVTSVVPGHGVHAAGYCLGGTLLAIGASAMARDGDTRLVSVSPFAAQTDFSEPGELSLSSTRVKWRCWKPAWLKPVI